MRRTDLQPVWNKFSLMINDLVKASIQQYKWYTFQYRLRWIIAACQWLCTHEHQMLYKQGKILSGILPPSCSVLICRLYYFQETNANQLSMEMSSMITFTLEDCIPVSIALQYCDYEDGTICTVFCSNYFKITFYKIMVPRKVGSISWWKPEVPQLWAYINKQNTV